jgi:hypothetical protein
MTAASAAVSRGPFNWLLQSMNDEEQSNFERVFDTSDECGKEIAMDSGQ